MKQQESYVRGANYVPARRMNTYQVWWRFNEEQIHKEMGYARRINLNALRMWLSPERWWEAPEEVQAQLDLLLETAQKNNLHILLCLFKNCGPVQQTPDMLRNEDPVTGYEVHSPDRTLLRDTQQWGPCYEYVDWFMNRYCNDKRLLAIEVMNEPGLYEELENTFAETMLARVIAQRGKTPITMGCFQLPHNRRFADQGIDIMQAHPNFLASEEAFHAFNEERIALEKETGLPCWATEWQRIRKGPIGWDFIFPEGDEWKPDHASLAPLFHQHQIGNFFWSLMLRPSYLKIHDKARWLNGVFHEDGSVYSLRDARAIANNPTLALKENPDWPAWASENGNVLQRFLQSRQGATSHTHKE